MLGELKAACRSLLKSPWFTAIAVLTLAIGIGANTAIFGVVNKLLLNLLPYEGAEQLVYVRLVNSRSRSGLSIQHTVADAWQQDARALDGIEFFMQQDVLAYNDGEPRVLRAMRITPGLPALLHVEMLHGRSFTLADAEAGAPAVAMLGYEAWQRDYAGAQDVVGRTITFDDAPHVVVGVLPPGWEAFTRGRRVEVWTPFSVADAPPVFQPIEVIARLPPDGNIGQTTAELDTILQRVRAEIPQPPVSADAAVQIDTPSQGVSANTREALLVLLAAVGLVLLVACSDVANLLLARGASRARELSLRSALGASTSRLVRALLAECLMLAMAAGVLGVGLGWATLRVVERVRPNNSQLIDEVSLDATVLTFTFAIATATALLFGIAPTLQLASRKRGDVLRSGASGVVRGGRGSRLRKLLVAAQMALSVMLLISAGLLVRSFVHLQNVDVGFDTNNLFSAQLALPRGRYSDPASQDVLADQLLDRVRAMPTVVAATQAFVAPPTRVAGYGWQIRGVPPAETPLLHSFNYVSPEYFDTLRIRIIEGRTFTTEEVRSYTGMVINRTAAQAFWPKGGALGAEVRWHRNWGSVVGIVDNVVSGALTQDRDEPQVYYPIRAEQGPRAIGALPTILLIVRAAGDPALAIAGLRGALQELDPTIPTPTILVTENALAGSIDGPRFNMVLLTSFAVIGLLLAAVGLAAGRRSLEWPLGWSEPSPRLDSRPACFTASNPEIRSPSSASSRY
jgi:putative ABC transport system permease protein